MVFRQQMEWNTSMSGSAATSSLLNDLLLDQTTESEADMSEAPLKVLNIFYTLKKKEDLKYSKEGPPPAVELFLTTFGVLANLFVIVVSLCNHSAYRIRSYMFVLSLAISDMLVCGVVMLFSMMIQLESLNLGSSRGYVNTCILWASFTTSACSAASLNVFVITLDRFLLLVFPLRYDSCVTTSQARMLICGVWVLSLVGSCLVMLFGFGARPREELLVSNVSGNQSHTDSYELFDFITTCNSLPSREFVIILVISVIILPCLFIVGVYIKIFQLGVKHVRIIKEERRTASRLRELSLRQSWKTPATLDPPTGQDWSTRAEVPSPNQSSYQPTSVVNTLQDTVNEGEKVSLSDVDIEEWEYDQSKSRTPQARFTKSAVENSVYAESATSDGFTPGSLFSEGTKARHNTVTHAVNRLTTGVSFHYRTEVKMVVVLTAIAGTHVFCWLPFGIFSLMQVSIPNYNNNQAREILLWLLYSNSCWNPLIYALLTRDFRLSFVSMCKRHLCHKSYPNDAY